MSDEVPLLLAKVLIAVIGLASFFMIRAIMINRKAKEPRQKINKVAMVRMWIGLFAIAFAVPFLMGGFLALNISGIFILSSADVTDQAQKQFTLQKADYLDSKGWAFLAVGIGLTFTAAQFLVDAYEKRRS